MGGAIGRESSGATRQAMSMHVTDGAGTGVQCKTDLGLRVLVKEGLLAT